MEAAPCGFESELNTMPAPGDDGSSPEDLNEGELWLSALQSSDFVAWRWNPQTDALTFSSNAGDVLKLPEGMTIDSGERWFSLIHPQEREDHERHLHQAIEQGVNYFSQFRIVVPNVESQILWIEDRGQAVLSSNGATSVTGILSDITDRKLKEEAQQRAVSRLEATLAAAKIGTWEYDVVQGRLWADANMAHYFGLSPEEAQGGPLEPYMRAMHPDDRDRVAQAIQEAIDTGDLYQCEYRLLLPDQTLRWVIARGRIERDTEGKTIHFPGIVFDVTAQREAETKAAHLAMEADRDRRLFETILSSSPDYIYTFDLDGRFTFANQRLISLWGERGVNLIGETFNDLEDYPRHIAERLTRQVQQVIATGQPVRDEVTRDYGTKIMHFDYILVPVIGENGEVEAVAGSTRDITERKEHERLLEESDRRKDEFLAVLAHELRNPLAPIRTGIEILKISDQFPDSLEHVRRTMERQMEQLIVLVNDLLDISRITLGKLHLRPAKVDLADVIGNAVDSTKPEFEAKKHHFEVRIPDIPMPVEVDPHRLAQIYSNLLTNAAKYTPEGGEISLTVELLDTEVLVRVRDNGIGIPTAQQEHIFDMFGQVDNQRSGSAGLGIGLTLVKSLVELHNGSVGFHSDGADQGSEFWVRIPRLPMEEAPASEAVEPKVESPPPHTSRKKVLIVDDNPASVETMSMAVEMFGHETQTARDGVEAVEVAEQFRPEIVLMDIGMPRMNGYEAARAIREKPWGTELILVALSGWGQDSDRHKAFDAGFNHHLVKPAEPSKIRALFDSLDASPE